MADAKPPDMRAFNQTVIAEFRAGGGRVGGRLEGTPLVLLTTTGASSGQQRTTPLGYVTDGTPDRLVLLASNLGAAEHPAWYRNLVARPAVTIEVGGDRFQALAATAAGAERDRLLQAFVSRFPATAAHAGLTAREIPVVVVERVR